jgi:hypothetical protein
VLDEVSECVVTAPRNTAATSARRHSRLTASAAPGFRKSSSRSPGGAVGVAVLGLVLIDPVPERVAGDGTSSPLR